MTGHYDETTLYDYLDDPQKFGGREELEAHLAECAPCRDRLEQLREFESALESTTMWDYAEALRNHREPPPSIRTLADMLSAEDAEAEKLLAPVIDSPAAFRRANVGASPRMQTAGTVRTLCAAARERRERQPMHGLALADAAVAITEQLSRERYPSTLLADLRGNAWLERANVLRYLGRFAEALDALDIAEKSFLSTPVAAHSIALVDYVRSVVFVKSDRLDDATRLARASARVFRQFGEEDRFLHAKIVEATSLFLRHRYREALELFLSLVPPAKDLGDAATLARLYANSASCHIALGETSAGSELCSMALSLYEALGMETEKVRARWTLGRMQLAAGDLPGGLARLRQTRSEFEALGLTSDAALVTLDIVEALLAAGDAREVPMLCSALVESFTNAGLTGSALTALAYLRESVAVGSATPQLVQHVRQFLEALPQTDHFVPPQG